MQNKEQSGVDVANIFTAIPSNLSEEFSESIVDTGHLRIERIVSKGHCSPETGWYDQQQNEWVIVLQGEGLLIFEDGQALRLKQGDHLNIPAHRRHRVSWTAPDIETVWLAVHY